MFRIANAHKEIQVSKDDIMGLSEPLPAPGLLGPHRELLKSFMQHSHALVNLLLSLLNNQLGLPHDKLSSLHRLASVSGDQVRWVHAPPQPTDDRRTALGQHTDFGSVTILFNRLGGLQVLPPNSNEWSYVKPLRGHAVINLGDAMVKFSAGILRSNIHRVVNPPGQQADHTRMSLVYFARPADDVILKALNGSTLIDEERRQNPEKLDEEEITSKEWILRRALGRRQGGDWTKAGGTDSARLGT
jgi:isopenicillin N synthase-like dioxygenase